MRFRAPIRLIICHSLSIFSAFLPTTIASAQELPLEEPQKQLPPSQVATWQIPTAQTFSKTELKPDRIYEEFTAFTLPAGKIRLGTDLDYGVSDQLTLGTDLVANFIGVPTLYFKYQVYMGYNHSVALSGRAAYLRKNLLFWGSLDRHFEILEGQTFRPGIAWTYRISERLHLHTFWTKSFGEIEAGLTEKGKRALWKSKYPDQSYDDRDSGKASSSSIDPRESQNIERLNSNQNSHTHQSIQVQSIAGISQDRFQLTGQLKRSNGNLVLFTTRVEQSKLEDLKSNMIRLTAAHQWIWASFQMRLGVGMQYLTLNGMDLDGEKMDEAGVQPASDIAFYWYF